MYDFTWYCKLWYDDKAGYTDYDFKKMHLMPAEEVFITEGFVEDLTEAEIEEVARKEDLHSFIDDLVKYRIASGNPYEQLDMLPNTRKRAVEIAKSYIDKAFDVYKVK